MRHCRVWLLLQCGSDHRGPIPEAVAGGTLGDTDACCCSGMLSRAGASDRFPGEIDAAVVPRRCNRFERLSALHCAKPYRQRFNSSPAMCWLPTTVNAVGVALAGRQVDRQRP
jgi:hypothetical protein